MSNDNIDEFAELREIFTKYTFSRENDKIMVKFGDFSRNYDEKLSVEIHSVIEKYEKFSFITTTEEAIIFNFSTFNITTNLVDYSIDFEYSEGDVGEFDFIDFIAEYEKLFNESQELRERFNNYDICVTIDLKLMAKFRDMTSFEINNINQNIHNEICEIIEYLMYECISYTNVKSFVYDLENYKICVDFDKITVINNGENTFLYSLSELKEYIHPEQTNVETETTELPVTPEIKTEQTNVETETTELPVTPEIKTEEVDFSELLRQVHNDMDACEERNIQINKLESSVKKMKFITNFLIITFVALLIKYYIQ
jgi:hypothetical protein